MELTIVNKRSLGFKQILDTIHELPITETNLNFTHKGLDIQTMDASHVSVVILNIDREYFETYQCETPVTIGINLDILTKLLKSVTKLDSLTLAKRQEDDYLYLSINNKSRTQEFNVPIFEFNTDAMSIPEIEYPVIYTVDSDEFGKILNDISLVDGRDVTLTMGDKRLIMSSIGDLGTTNITIDGQMVDETPIPSSSPPICTIIRDNDALSASFTLEFLRNISKAKIFSKQGAIISFSENFPLCICYPFGVNSNLRLHLAPKLEEDS